MKNFDSFEETPRQLELFNVEDCFRLTTGQFGRHILRRAEKPIPDLEKTFTIRNGGTAKIFFKFFKDGSTAWLRIRCCANGRWFAQDIELDYTNANYGLRPFFLCDCGYRASVLYLRPNSHRTFSCRSCLHLRYELQTFNKNGKNNRFIYVANRVNKLITMEEKLRRPVYNHNATNRFWSFAIARQKWVPIDRIPALTHII